MIPPERWDPVGAAIVALIPDANASAGGQPIYASTPDHRYAAGPVRRPHRPPVHVELHDLRPLQLRGHADVPSGAAAGAGGGLVQRRVWIERQSIAGARARRHLDDLPDARRGHPLRGVARRLLHESAELRHRRRRGSRPEERAERSRDRRRRAEGQHPGLRRRRPAHVDAAVPDAPHLESARDVQPEPRVALHQVRRRVPQSLDADQRPECDGRADEFREPLHQSRRRRSAPGAAVPARPDELHGHGPGTEHAVLLRPGRLPRVAEAHGQRGPALRVRHAAAREGQPVRQFRSGDRHDGLCEGRQRLRARADPSRSQQLRAAHRVRLRAGGARWSCAAATASSTRTPSGRAARGCSGSILRT